jgi:hypothetical protein
MADAFGEGAERSLPRCRGRHPHLRIFKACGLPTRTIVLGASNSWFPVIVSVLSVPFSREPVEQKVGECWRLLRDVTSPGVFHYARVTHPELVVFAKVSDQELWDAIQHHKKTLEHDTHDVPDILGPEWMMFANPADAPTSDDFRLQ